MKFQCNVCEVTQANVLCCADEAALCWVCDEKFHTDKGLVNQHQRVPLSSSNSDMPNCDICQERIGYFFCLEDKALLCRKCDIGIHTSNAQVSMHQRFLITGVKVCLEANEPRPCPSPSCGKVQSINENPEQEFSLSNMNTLSSSTYELSTNLPGQTISSSMFPLIEGSASAIISQLDEFLELSDLEL